MVSLEVQGFTATCNCRIRDTSYIQLEAVEFANRHHRIAGIQIQDIIVILKVKLDVLEPKFVHVHSYLAAGLYLGDVPQLNREPSISLIGVVRSRFVVFVIRPDVPYVKRLQEF